MELGRHAAYILLTGPQTEGASGTVVLTKRKLKQDVTLSNVLRIGSVEDSETNEAIKEAFNRLRFSSQWANVLKQNLKPGPKTFQLLTTKENPSCLEDISDYALSSPGILDFRFSCYRCCQKHK